MSWKHWPYWLKGLIIGTLIGLLLLFYSDYCSKQQKLLYPEDMYASLRCPWLYTEGPGLLFSVVLYHAGVSGFLGSFSDSFAFEKAMIVIGWSLCGIIVGLLIEYVKSRRKNSTFKTRN